MKMKISHKVRKVGKPRGRKPSPKKRDEEDAWMDGVIKTPHYDIHPCIYKNEWRRTKPSTRKKFPPKKEKKETR